MSKKVNNEFIPDYAVPPGETLLETISAIGMSQAELAIRMGRPKKTINEIIKGKAEITPETALQLERVLGIPAHFWNNLERNYREVLARIKEYTKLQKQIEWLGQFPVKALIKKRWIKKYNDKTLQLQELLNFFGVASPEQWQKKWFGLKVAYRRSPAFQSDPGAVSAWLRMGELLAQKIRCNPYDANKFKSVLSDILKLTVDPPEIFQSEMERLCADAGVAVVFVPELPRIRTSGATWWMNPKKAVIQLSLRYKTDDQLWFSFFHEAGHILLHGKKEVFIEGDNYDNDKEEEANRFASNILIPERDLQQFIGLSNFSKRAIKKFAEKIGVSPGIVVGRLQYLKVIPYSHCNDLKRRFEWQL